MCNFIYCVIIFMRIKRGNSSRLKRRKILNLAKGFKGTGSTLYRIANQQVMKALRYSYKDRKQKKRKFRRIWISRINASTRLLRNSSYNKLINDFKMLNICLNRKLLSQIAILDTLTFSKLLDLSDSISIS